jgi:hypothetical protein
MKRFRRVGKGAWQGFGGLRPGPRAVPTAASMVGTAREVAQILFAAPGAFAYPTD